MRKHSDYKDDETPKFLKWKFVVGSEEDKQELIETSKHLHDEIFECGDEAYGLDSDIMGVNFLMHIYTTPDLIEVKPEEFE